MKKNIIILGTILLGLSLTAMSPTPNVKQDVKKKTTNQSACVDIDRIHSRQIIDGRTLYLRSRGGGAVLVTLSAPCTQMQEMDRLDFVMHGSSTLCRRGDIDIYHSRFGETPIRCLINEVKPLTEAQWKAIEAQ